MDITRHSTVADVATAIPATIKVFQHHQIDFCCGGRRPIAEACVEHGLDVDALLGELQAITASPEAARDWSQTSLTDLIAYIQARFHEPLRAELPRLRQMMDKVVSRHGERMPETLPPLQQTLQQLERELLDHMMKEDVVLFPAVAGLDSGAPGQYAWIDMPIEVMEAEHDQAAAALARMRELTDGYTPPADACPTFRGLYYGLSELEREMHVHVHLENNVLFPRASERARSR